MATVEPKVAKTPEDHEKDTRVAERDRRVRLSVMGKGTTKNASKVDIRPVGPNRFRVNVWAETGSAPAAARAARDFRKVSRRMVSVS